MRLCPVDQVLEDELPPPSVAIPIEKSSECGDHRCKGTGIYLDDVVVPAAPGVDWLDTQDVFPGADDATMFAALDRHLTVVEGIERCVMSV